MPTDPDSISTAISDATAAIVESSPWLRDLIEESASQTANVRPTLPTSTQHSTPSTNRRMAVLEAIPGACPFTGLLDCQCSPLAHRMNPVTHPRSTSLDQVPMFTGPILHFPTCATCGNSYPDARPCH